MKNLLIAFLLSTAACAPPSAQPAAAPKPAPSAGAEASAAAQGRSEEPAEPDGPVERLYRIKDDPGAPSMGAQGAKVIVQVFSDFECPYCAALAPTLRALASEYGDRVRFVWRHFPLPFHEHALGAAEAAVEVQQQVGAQGFWKFHDLLFAQQDRLSADDLVQAAGQIEGVDPQKVKAALASRAHVPRVRADMEAALDSGAGSEGFGTPAVFINGRLISGAQPIEVFRAALERALSETPAQRAVAERASAAAYPMARLRHVLIQYKGAARADESITRSKEEARALAAEIVKLARAEGADFGALARERSDGPSGQVDGKLGWVTRGTLVPAFEETAFALQPGDVSDVVETDFGFHVILREE